MWLNKSVFIIQCFNNIIGYSGEGHENNDVDDDEDEDRDRFMKAKDVTIRDD